jgi:hypothetical protein
MRVLRIARPVSLAVLTTLLLLPGLLIGPGFDAAVYTLAGVTIRQGGMPYTDLFDNKPPGLYLLNAIGQVVLPPLDPWQVSWLLSVAFSVAAVLVLELVLRRSTGSAAAFLLAGVVSIGIAAHPIAYGGGFTETFAILPLVVGLWLLGRTALGLREAGEIGLLAGVACLFSLQALPVAALLTVGVAASAPHSWRHRVGRALAAVGAAALGPLLVVAWLAARGALGDAIDQVATYNTWYRAASPGFGNGLPASLLLLAGLFVPAAIGVILMLRSPRSFGRVTWVCLAWVAAEAALLAYEHRLFLHYLILVVPPLVLVSVPGWNWLVGAVRSTTRTRRNTGILAAAVVACLVVVSGTVVIGLTAITTASAANGQSVTAETSAWIDSNTAPSTTVFVWGNDTGVLLMSGRRSYDRYVYQFPIVTPGYWTAARTEALLVAWTAAPPEVVVESPATVPMFQAQPNPSESPSLDTLAPLRDFVRARYLLAASFQADGYAEDVYIYAPAT